MQRRCACWCQAAQCSTDMHGDTHQWSGHRKCRRRWVNRPVGVPQPPEKIKSNQGPAIELRSESNNDTVLLFWSLPQSNVLEANILSPFSFSYYSPEIEFLAFLFHLANFPFFATGNDFCLSKIGRMGRTKEKDQY